MKDLYVSFGPPPPTGGGGPPERFDEIWARCGNDV